MSSSIRVHISDSVSLIRVSLEPRTLLRAEHPASTRVCLEQCVVLDPYGSSSAAPRRRGYLTPTAPVSSLLPHPFLDFLSSQLSSSFFPSDLRSRRYHLAERPRRGSDLDLATLISLQIRRSLPSRIELPFQCLVSHSPPRSRRGDRI